MSLKKRYNHVSFFFVFFTVTTRLRHNFSFLYSFFCLQAKSFEKIGTQKKAEKRIQQGVNFFFGFFLFVSIHKN